MSLERDLGSAGWAGRRLSGDEFAILLADADQVVGIEGRGRPARHGLTPEANGVSFSVPAVEEATTTGVDGLPPVSGQLAVVGEIDLRCLVVAHRPTVVSS